MCLGLGEVRVGEVRVVAALPLGENHCFRGMKPRLFFFRTLQREGVHP